MTNVNAVIETIDSKYLVAKATTNECVEDFWVQFSLNEDGTIVYKDDYTEEGGFETINDAIEDYISALMEAAETEAEETCSVKFSTVQIGWDGLDTSFNSYNDDVIGYINFTKAMEYGCDE